jgi:hypothetical protein
LDNRLMENRLIGKQSSIGEFAKRSNWTIGRIGQDRKTGLKLGTMENRELVNWTTGRFRQQTKLEQVELDNGNWRLYWNTEFWTELNWRLRVLTHYKFARIYSQNSEKVKTAATWPFLDTLLDPSKEITHSEMFKHKRSLEHCKLWHLRNTNLSFII